MRIISRTVLMILVAKQGYYLPWGVLCGIMTTIGAGLISSWTPTTSAGLWIGYQIIFGAGRGAGMQIVSAS
jgi:hypothetical protein